MNRKERRENGHRGPAPEKVIVAYCHPGEVSASFMASVVRLIGYELRRTGGLVGTLEKIAGTGNVAHVRNLITGQFLKTDAEWLLFVDADMGFPEWALHRMLGAADKKERPIIGGLCFALMTAAVDEVTNAEIYECFPTIGVWNYNEDGSVIGYRYLEDYPDDTVCKVDTSGAAFLLIHRSALETIGKDWWSHIQAPANVPGLNSRTLFGEDISFFMRCAQNDIPVWLDTAVKTSHHKGGIYLTHELYVQQEARKKALKALEAELVDAT